MTARPPDLADLVAATAAGDRAAFAELYGQVAPKLLGVVLRILRDRSAAEDVVQDAFVRIWHGAAGYSPAAGRPMTWMIAVARHRAIDVVRARRDHLAHPIDDGCDAWEHVPDPVDAEQGAIDRDRLRRCLGTLDEQQRSCFLLAYRDGASREELARRFDRPVNTIKTWLHRSAVSLRDCLGEP